MTTEASAQVPLVGRVRGLGFVSLFGLFLVALVVFWVVVNFVKFPADSTNVLLIGVTTGALYGLVALGYTLVYGILELINFAHGDVFMIGGMIAATFALDVFDLGPSPALGILVVAILVSLAACTVGCGLLNATIERIAYRPLRSAPRLVPLITAIGMSFILQDVGLIWKGSLPVQLPPKTLPTGDVFTLGTCPKCATYRWDQFFVLM